MRVKSNVRRRQVLPASKAAPAYQALFRVVSEHGIPGATMARVAESAGVGIGTVSGTSMTKGRCFNPRSKCCRRR
jgi:hypothetical protein